MIDQNGYDYDTFLSDSSDDHPKYADGLSQEQLNVISELGFEVKQIDDEMLINEEFHQPFHSEPPSNLIALENVLGLAEGNNANFCTQILARRQDCQQTK